MTRHEDKAFRVGKTKPTLPLMKSQLARLKEDLGQFQARKPGTALVTSLKERIRDLEGEIAAAEAAVQARRTRRDEGGEAAEGEANFPTHERYPSRRR